MLPDGRTLSYVIWGQPEGTPVLLLSTSPGSRLLGWMAAAASLQVPVDADRFGVALTPTEAAAARGIGSGGALLVRPMASFLAQQRPARPRPTTELGGVLRAVLSTPGQVPRPLGGAPDAGKSSPSSKPTEASPPHAELMRSRTGKGSQATGGAP